MLSGGKGADLFNFNVNHTSDAGQDTIVDFRENRNLINLGDFGSFDDLDTNGDGKLNNRDDFVTKTDDTIRIDVGAAFGLGAGSQVLTVSSYTSSVALDSDDFLFLA